MKDDLGFELLFHANKITEHIPDKETRLEKPRRVKIGLNEFTQEFGIALKYSVRNFESISKRDPSFKDIYLGIQVMLIKQEERGQIKVRRSVINKEDFIHKKAVGMIHRQINQ